MQLITANLLCLNPWQPAAIQQLLLADADLLILPEVKPSLLFWLRALSTKAGYTLIEAHTNQQMALCLLSRLPIRQSHLIDQGIFAGRPQLRVDLMSGITIFGIHLMAPITVRKYQERNQQLKTLGELIRAEPTPVVASGDFNTHVSETVFREFLQRAEGIVDEQFPAPKSWPSLLPLVTLDHVVYTRHLRLARLERGKFNGSDHFPIAAQLLLKD